MPNKLIYAAIIISLLLGGCAKKAEKVESTTNPEVPVETLFTKDGCTVYRFKDNGDKHYFVRCNTTTETIQTISENCGKGCTKNREENIPTEYQ